MGKHRHKDKLTQFTPMLHHTMECGAWLALTPYSKALYPFLKQRAGYNGNKNGAVSCSVREAATYLGTSINTAVRALRELQRKGFLVAVRVGRLGVAGEGKATTWRLTELGTPAVPRPTKEYLGWSPRNEFPVAEAEKPDRVIDRRVNKKIPVS